MRAARCLPMVCGGVLEGLGAVGLVKRVSRADAYTSGRPQTHQVVLALLRRQMARSVSSTLTRPTRLSDPPLPSSDILHFVHERWEHKARRERVCRRLARRAMLSAAAVVGEVAHHHAFRPTARGIRGRGM